VNDQELHNEETLQTQKDIKKALEGSAIIPLPKLPEKFKAEITNQIEAKVLGEIEVNDKPFTALSKDLQQQIAGLVTHITKTIVDNTHAPLEAITVKNIKDAKADEVMIKNIGDFSTEVSRLVKAVIDNKPVINLETKEVKMPNTARDYVSVRLTNGKQFYEAITKVNASGGGTGNTDPTVGYQIADKATVGDYKYFGFINSQGAWYIMREDTVNYTYRYIAGSPRSEQGGGLYTDAWTDKANLSYDYFNKVW
jgi:hypothetical protein